MPSKLFGSQTAARPHLVNPGGGLSGEVYDLREDVEAAFLALESGGGLLRTDEFTDPAAADVDAIKTSFASSTSITTLTNGSGDFDGVVGDGEMTPPRNITFTTSLSGDIDAVAVVITGRVRDETGALVAQTETVTLTDGGNVTDAGAEPFSIIDSIVIPAQSGTGGSIQIGFGDIMGLSGLIAPRAGLIAPVREVVAGAVVTTGTFTNETGSPVTSYLPATVPDGSNDYAITYEPA